MISVMQLNQKKCAKIMKPQNQLKEPQKSQNKLGLLKQQFNSFSVDPHNSVFKTPKKQAINVQEQGSSSKKQKFCMSQLCQAFLQKFSQSTEKPIIFYTKDLIDDFSVKQRRIYDLMNIMEGLDCVKKQSKGKYEWKGINMNTDEQVQTQKGESNSLRHIAARIKILIFEAESPVSFTQIYDKLFEQDNKMRPKQINPISLRRRIYQCCKVLKMLGVVRKFDKKYEWNYSEKEENTLIKKEQQIKRSPIRRARRITFTQKQLIKQIIRRYKTDIEIQNFIDQLNRVKKEQLQTTVKKEEERIDQDPEEE